jgi:DNA-binding HxlR family transcriptional regulator
MMSGDTIKDLANGLSGRLRALVNAQDRLDRLESGSGQWRSGFVFNELDESAEFLTLRVLHTTSDPLNFTILQSLATADSLPIPSLMSKVGVGRLILSERLNDLVQVGLVTRLIDTDHAQITAAGAGIVDLVNQISTQIRDAFQEKNP